MPARSSSSRNRAQLALVGKHVLAERRAKRRQFLVDRRQPLLAGRRPAWRRISRNSSRFFPRPAASLGRGRARRGSHRDGRCGQTASRSSRSPRNAATSSATRRAPAPGCFIGVGAGPAPEDRGDTVQRVAGELERGQACSRSSADPCIAGDRLDLGRVHLDGGVEHRAEIMVGDARKIWEAERAVPVRQRVLVGLDSAGLQVLVLGVGALAGWGRPHVGRPGVCRNRSGTVHILAWLFWRRLPEPAVPLA